MGGRTLAHPSGVRLMFNPQVQKKGKERKKEKKSKSFLLLGPT